MDTCAQKLTQRGRDRKRQLIDAGGRPVRRAGLPPDVGRRHRREPRRRQGRLLLVLLLQGGAARRAAARRAPGPAPAPAGRDRRRARPGAAHRGRDPRLDGVVPRAPQVLHAGPVRRQRGAVRAASCAATARSPIADAVRHIKDGIVEGQHRRPGPARCSATRSIGVIDAAHPGVRPRPRRTGRRPPTPRSRSACRASSGPDPERESAELGERLADAPHGLPDALLVLDQREAHEALAAGPEARRRARPRPSPRGRASWRTRGCPSPRRAPGSAPTRTSCPCGFSISHPMRASPSTSASRRPR